MEKHLDISDPDIRPAGALAAATGLSKSAIKSAMTKGAVWLTRDEHTQRLRRADKPLKAGDELHLYYNAKVLAQQVADAVLIADEGAYSVWFKPYGMLSQGSKWGDHCTINRWVERHLQPQRPAFIVHRLDRAASGLMVLAHGRKTAAKLAGLFEERLVEKRYRALVQGRFPDEMTLDEPLDGKQARSHARRLDHEPSLDQSLVEVRIETGRKHQIRRHLSGAGFPIVGDRLYGEMVGGDDRDLCLVSCCLSFASPVDGEAKRYRLPDGLVGW